MIDYKEIIEKNPAGVLATQNGKNVTTRYVSCALVQDNKVYFWTDATKPMTKQIEANPLVSFCISAKNYNPVLSFQGKVNFVNDGEQRSNIWNDSDVCKNMYGTIDNPSFRVFYIDLEEVNVYVPGEGTTRHQIK